MVLEKKVYFIKLFDIYKNLLTKKQQEVFTYYFLDDISLNEIAESLSISKQGVKYQLDKAKTALEKYESILKINSKLERQNALIKSESEELEKKIFDIWGED